MLRQLRFHQIRLRQRKKERKKEGPAIVYMATAVTPML